MVILGQQGLEAPEPFIDQSIYLLKNFSALSCWWQLPHPLVGRVQQVFFNWGKSQSSRERRNLIWLSWPVWRRWSVRNQGSNAIQNCGFSSKGLEQGRSRCDQTNMILAKISLHVPQDWRCFGTICLLALHYILHRRSLLQITRTACPFFLTQKKFRWIVEHVLYFWVFSCKKLEGKKCGWDRNKLCRGA